MQTNCLENDPKNPSAEDTMKLEVLLMHEDLPAGLRGKQALDQLAEQLGVNAEFCVHLWRFDLMNEASLRHQAVEDARKANIVVLAVRNGAGLPAPVRTWLIQWLQCRSSVPCAIVVSLDAAAQAAPASHPALDYVRAVSGPAGVDLFQHYANTLPVAWDWSTRSIQQSDSTLCQERFTHRPALHAA